MEEYFSKGTVDNPVISNSALSCINPEQGGSIRKFLNFFSGEGERKNSLSLEKGKLIHKYIENKDAFVLSELVEPTEMMSKLIKECVTIAINKGPQLNGVDTNIVSKNKAEKNRATEVLEIQSYYEKLSNLLEVSVEDSIRIFRVARERTQSYMSQGEGTVLNNIVSKKLETDYIKFLKKSNGKIILSKDVKTAVEGAVQSLYNHPLVSKLLRLQQDDGVEDVNPDEIVYRELPVYWTDNVPLVGFQERIQVECKALLDRLVINHVLKTITLTDLKSTADCIYLFQVAFERYRYYRQVAWYTRAINFWFKLLYPNLNLQEYKLVVNIIPVETTGLFLTGVYRVDQTWLFKGTTEYRNLMERYAWHKATGEYIYSKEEHQNKGILTFNPPKQ